MTRVSVPFFVLSTLLFVLNVVSASPVPQATRSSVTPQQCPNNTVWQRIEDYFDVLNETTWTLNGAAGANFSRTGANLTVTEQLTMVVLQSHIKLAAPVSVEIDIMTTATPGVASAFFLGALDGGEEIDLEICKKQFQLPIWEPGTDGKSRRIDMSEIKEELSGGTKPAKNLIGTYGYQYKGYDPRKWTTYRLDWGIEEMHWSIDDSERVRYTKVTELPQGPLPMRLGPWQTEGTWCGAASWEQNPVATMQVRRLIVEGCMTTT